MPTKPRVHKHVLDLMEAKTRMDAYKSMSTMQIFKKEVKECFNKWVGLPGPAHGPLGVHDHANSGISDLHHAHLEAGCVIL